VSGQLLGVREDELVWSNDVWWATK
jgi:hypothetical protein